jgi:CheY-like chemotaxis protein
LLAVRFGEERKKTGTKPPEPAWHGRRICNDAADEAIAIQEASPDIHVIFTDIQMPGSQMPGSMDGLKLARFVRDRWRRAR